MTDHESGPFSCPKGTIFCLEWGICAKSCNIREKRDESRALWRDIAYKVPNSDINGDSKCPGYRNYKNGVTLMIFPPKIFELQAF